ncbi:MAG TPA: MFS transporter [Microbacteriaceae bacterium]|nr:MFS transporter [Microbacteriaceae bacterium]
MTETPDPPTAVGTEPRVQRRWRRDITIFLTGQMVSLFGSMLVQYAIMWHLALVTKSGLVLTLSIVFGMLPQAIVSIFGGVWADRMNRKVLIILADSSIAVSTLVLAVVMLSGYEELWLIYLTLAIRSFGAGIQQPAVAALLPQLVPGDQLLRFNGLFQSAQAGMMLVAPPVAAAVYASMSIIAIFFIDAITAAIGIALLLSIAVPTIRAIDTQRGYFTDLVEGVRYTFRHRLVRWVLLLLTIVMLLGAAPSYLTPLMIVRTFGEDVWLLTVSEVAFAVGMLVAGGVVAAIGPRITRPVVLAVAMTALFGGLNIALGLSPTIWIFAAFMLLAGAAIPLMSTPLTTLLQLRVEPQLHGRVFGLVGVVMSVAMPVGMVVLGPLSDVVQVETLLIVAGAITFIAVAAVSLMPAGRGAIRERIDPAEAAALGGDAILPTMTGPVEVPRPGDTD